MTTEKAFIFSTENRRTRLDRFLKERMSELSRVSIQKLIRRGGVKVNGVSVSPHTLLKTGDVVDVRFDTMESLSSDPKQDFSLDIIFENDDFLIVNKPAGIVVHPTPHHPNRTLVDAILNHDPAIARVGEYLFRPGIVHRLDKDASGLLVVAKNQASFEHLKRQFKERKVKKKYLALVHGTISPQTGTITLVLGRSKQHRTRMAARPRGTVGRIAETVYQTIRTFSRYSLLEIETKTGRTHQIRAHLHALGHPLVGDTVYTTKRIKPMSEFGRVFLHACFLSFKDLGGKKQSFQIDLPDPLKRWLDRLH